jgi:hypothetical protein
LTIEFVIPGPEHSDRRFAPSERRLREGARNPVIERGRIEQIGKRAAIEALSEHGSRLQRNLIHRGMPVQPGLNEALHRAWNGGPVTFGGVPQKLLEKERVSRRAIDTVLLEQLARQPLRALRYDDRVGLRPSLQASGEVRRFADGAALRVGVGPDDVTDEHRTGRNAQAHGKSLRPRLELRDRRNDSKRSANGALGIVLRCNRITKISKRTIPEILRHMAVKSSHRVGHAGMIGSDDFAEVLGIKPR